MTCKDSEPGIQSRLSLKIVVTDAGRQAAFRALVRQSIPILRNPEAYRIEQRQQMAQRLEAALDCTNYGMIGNSELEDI